MPIFCIYCSSFPPPGSCSPPLQPSVLVGLISSTRFRQAIRQFLKILVFQSDSPTIYKCCGSKSGFRSLSFAIYSYIFFINCAVFRRVGAYTRPPTLVTPWSRPAPSTSRPAPPSRSKNQYFNLIIACLKLNKLSFWK